MGNEAFVTGSFPFPRIPSSFTFPNFGGVGEEIDKVSKAVALPLSELCDSSSIARQVWTIGVTVSDKAAGLAFNIFGIIGSVLIIFNALRLIYKAASRMSNAQTAEMLALHSFVHLPANVAYLVVGMGMLALKVSSIAGKAMVAGISGLTLMWSFLAMSVLMFGEAVYSLHITYKLRDILEAEDDSDLSIQLLKELTENNSELVDGLVGDEYRNLIQKIDFDDQNYLGKKGGLMYLLKSTGKLETLLAKAKIAKLQALQKDDPEKFSLQVDEGSKECEGLLDRIKNFELVKEDLGSCDTLLAKVEHGNYDANTDAWILLGITTVSIGAASTGLAFTGPAGIVAEAAITLIASLGWTNFDSSKFKQAVKDYFWEHHQNCKKDDIEYGLEGRAKFAAKTAALILTAPLWVLPALVYHDVITEERADAMFESVKNRFGISAGVAETDSEAKAV